MPRAGLKTWFLETRPQFLLLTPAVTFVGLGALVHDQIPLNIPIFVLAFLGALLAHISVNVLNDYYDYLSGIDLKTNRTPFSGGSGILVNGLLEPKKVYFLGVLCLVIDFIIMLYFYTFLGWPIICLGIAGFILTYFYTSYLTKIGLAEFSAGAGFALIPVGIYYTQAITFSETILAAAVIVGITVANLLLLNEFPDTEADKEAGRKHIPALFGLKTAAKIYTMLYALLYLFTIISIYLKILPETIVVNFLSLPLAVETCRGVLKNYDNMVKLIPYMGKNVLLVFTIIVLTAIGLMI